MVPSDLNVAPRVLLAQACQAYGEGVVARWCADLLDGTIGYDDPNGLPLTWIGGRGAVAQLALGPLAERGSDYWPRVWAARGLRYAWDPAAAPAVVAALADPAWRVREMAAKVAGQRELGEAADALAGLVGDPVPRVRVAAVRAIGVTGEAEHAEVVRSAGDDPEPTVRRAVQVALGQLRRRLDREL